MPYRFVGDKAYRKGKPNAKPIPKKQAIAILIAEKKRGK
jgi:hypothetical protein